ncbi:MAG: MraY family glycosyltransferase [Balneolaceae bacterium]|nr:MraY family glycosyltransferase [Balneolaceae bacterium]
MEISAIYIIGLCSIIAFLISKTLVPVLLLVSKRKRLFDNGAGHHKLHTGLVPTLGGVAIFTAFMVTFSASSYADDISGFGYFVAASIILFAAGLKDDLIVISPSKKLGAQFLAAALIIFGTGIQFTNLGGVFGAESISPWFGIPLTFFSVIVIINSHNLIDGIDGLGGSIGVLASLFFGYWFYKAGLYHWAAFSFILTGSILGFLWFNFPPAKIFMGDTGSLVIGLYISVLAINFVEHSLTISDVVYWEDAVPVIVAAVLVVPLYDTLRIFIVRMFNGKSPFDADNDHVHHHLMRTGFNHAHIVVFLLAINVIILGSTIILSNYLSNTWLLFSLLTLCVLLFPTNGRKRNFIENFVPNEFGKEEADNETREPLSESDMHSESFLLDEKDKDSQKKVVHEA